MATKKPVISIIVDDETFKKIEDYQFENRINSRSKAINQIIIKGLELIEKESDKQRDIYESQLLHSQDNGASTERPTL